MIDAIILAAGESRRMGELKPIKRIKNKTFLQHIVGQLLKHVRHIIIVVGHRADEIKKQNHVGAMYVKNHGYKSGQFSSLQQGIKSIKDAQAVIVCLGDQPHIQAGWVEQIVQHFYRTHAKMIVPRYKGRGGHPVLYSAELFPIILDMEPTQTARDLRQKVDEIASIDIDDEGILLDADKPADLEKILPRIRD